MNRRARLVNAFGHKHPWVDFGSVTFVAAAMAYAKTFYASFVVSGDICPGQMFRVEVEDVDDSGAAVVPSCVFELLGHMEFDILNPRLGAE